MMKNDQILLKTKKTKFRNNHEFFCKLCNRQVSSQSKYEVCIGVRIALCLTYGKYDRSFAVELFYCKSCYNKLKSREVCSFLQQCEALIVNFPPLSFECTVSHPRINFLNIVNIICGRKLVVQRFYT